MASKVEGDSVSKTDKVVGIMFSPGYRFPQQDTDDNLKVEIRDLVSFGDIEDASNEKTQNAVVGGTVIGFICTVRHFVPGKYKVTVIKPPSLKEFPTKYEENDPLVIFHHENIDPNLLVLQAIRLYKDYSDFHKDCRNSINKYDWCHFNNWYCGETELSEDDDDDDGNLIITPHRRYVKANIHISSIMRQDSEKCIQATVPFSDIYKRNKSYPTMIYFTKTEKAKQLVTCIMKNQVRRSSVIENLFSVQDKNGDTISIGIDFTPFNSRDWGYAKAFQDSDTGSYFALVVNGYLGYDNMICDDGEWKDITYSKKEKDLGFTTVSETGVIFPMRNFLLKDI